MTSCELKVLEKIVRRHLRPIPIEQLARLTTARLLAFRDRMLALEESVELSDVHDDSDPAPGDPAFIYFKSDARWPLLYEAVKTELSHREHSSPAGR